MAEREPRSKEHVDRDGVRTVEGSGVRLSVWLLALAMTLVGLAVFVVVRPALEKPAPEPAASDVAAERPAPAAMAPEKQAQRRAPATIPAAAPLQQQPEDRPAPQAAAPRPEPVEAGGEPAAAADESLAAEAADEEAVPANQGDQPTGIAVFPPPGTKPIKRGIVVPEGIELPPGYIRHYQTTDDGRQLPPILMFHPDYHPVDENGDPIPLPEDRVVPPDMAPPGMPTETLQVPDEGAPDDAWPAGPSQGRRRTER